MADFSFYSFPLNLLAGCILIAGIAVLHIYYSNYRLVKRWGSMETFLGISAVIILILLLEGIWGGKWSRSWIFAGIWGILLVNLGLVIARHWYWHSVRNILFLLNHAGLWVALSAALLGTPDRKTLKMIVPLGQTEYTAVDAEGRLFLLPFTLQLKEFEADYYDPVTRRIPKHFRSAVILRSGGKEKEANVEVNKPADIAGYTVYQDDYDKEGNRYAVFLIVRDPWLGIVYTGIFMLMTGAVGLAVYGPLKKRTIK